MADPPVPKRGHAVGVLRHRRAVRGDQGGAALVTTVRKQRQDAALGRGVDLSGRFVGEKNLGARPPGPPPSRLAPPPRPRAGRGGPGDGPRARPDRAVDRAAARRAAARAASAGARCSRPRDVRTDCRTAAGCRSGGAQARAYRFGPPGQALAHQLDVAAVGLVQSGEAGKQGRLAAARRSREGDEVPPPGAGATRRAMRRSRRHRCDRSGTTQIPPAAACHCHRNELAMWFHWSALSAPSGAARSIVASRPLR